MIRYRLSNERGFMGLVALLLAVAIGFVLYATVISPKMSARDQQQRQQAREQAGVEIREGQTVAGAAIDKGKETSCQSQLSQIRQGMMMYKTENENNPPTLADLRLPVSQNFFQCPAGNEPYSYDPNTGVVKCVHPGHENL